MKHLFTKSEKMVLAVAAPLWIPFVTAASLLFLPVGVEIFIKETIKDGKQRRDYSENKVKYMKMWTTKIMEKAFTKDNIVTFIFDVYFRNFERRIKEICDEFIPKDIAAEKRQVDIIANDSRTSFKILTEFQHLLEDLKTIMKHLRLYELKYMAKDSNASSDVHTEKEVGRGCFSDVYLATWANATRKRVATKMLRRNMKATEMMSKLEQIECFRKFNHPKIVRIYGVCYNPEKDGICDNRLEYCVKTLEDLVFHDETLKCKNYKDKSDRYAAFKFYVTMATGVCEGLTEMHGKGYLHRDLKLSNVLVVNNIAKLCEPGCVRTEMVTTGAFVGSITHISRELIKHENYTFSSDIYSLAILLWELWYGRYLYTESDYNELTTFNLFEAVINDTLPELTWNFSPTKDLQEVIEDCWHAIPSNRPSAQEVGIKLGKMYQEYNKEVANDFFHMMPHAIFY